MAEAMAWEGPAHLQQVLPCDRHEPLVPIQNHTLHLGVSCKRNKILRMEGRGRNLFFELPPPPVYFPTPPPYSMKLMGRQNEEGSMVFLIMPLS